MSQLVELVKKQLTDEYERQKIMLEEQRDLKEAHSQLEQKFKNIIRQVEDLEKAKAPVDLIAWYVQTNGKVWISKKAFVSGNYPVEIGVDNRFILTLYLGTTNIFIKRRVM
jgi:hypothetical protein